MNNTEIKNNVIALVKKEIGNAEDNLYRTQLAFKNNTEKQMNEKYGQSSSTRQEIVDGYQRWFDDAKECLDWLNSLKV